MKLNKIIAIGAFTIPPLIGLGVILDTDLYWMHFNILVIAISVISGYRLFKK